MAGFYAKVKEISVKRDAVQPIQFSAEDQTQGVKNADGLDTCIGRDGQEV